MGIDVRRAAAAEIRPLRHTVLRPGHPPEHSVYPEDDGAVHLAAYDGERLVGCATVFPQPWPGPPRTAEAWRLRGMAVEPGRQGDGIGALVLAAAVAAAREAGAGVLWANGRSAALGFYLRQGWVVTGEEFVAAESGVRHYPIVLALH